LPFSETIGRGAGMSDEALMAAYQQGDLGAFAELVARHEQRLWSFLRRFVRDRSAAEDLLQEVFLRMIKSAPRWQPSAKVSTWLYTIARNLCTDQARRAVHRDTLSLDGSRPGADAEDGSGARPLMDRIPSAVRGAEREVMDREIAARIDEAVGKLPVEQREVFLMREVMEMPFAEIAAAVGTGEPTVKSRMRYALERLRVALEDLASVSEEGAAAVEAVSQRP
jgi:RNA polymerase sigma-70 factor, ECF subfamily